VTHSGDFAIVIGINKYPRLEARYQLEGPIDAARRFAAWLTAAGGVPVENCRLVLGESPADAPMPEPIQDQIDEAFAEIFEASEKIEARRLYFYFVGHGFAIDNEQASLLMANARIGMLNLGIDATAYRQQLSNKQRFFPEQIFIFDCCRQFDGIVRGRGPAWSLEPARDIDDVQAYTLYATEFTRFAHERSLSDGPRRCLLSTAVMEGLEGAAAVPRSSLVLEPTEIERLGEHVVTMSSLARYAIQRVKALEPEQVPKRLDVTNRDLVVNENVPTPPNVIVRGNGGPPSTVTVVSDARPARDLGLNGDAINVFLPAGKYAFTHDGVTKGPYVITATGRLTVDFKEGRAHG
jgi:hypothetical protein